ncbi:MAG: DinB family protein [Planctomycetes bacterium]|nr:DinB family protein [Planctomycetota bacterium]
MNQTLASLRRTKAAVLRAFDWDARTLARAYGPGKWTGREILGHLTDCELVYLTRLKFLLAADHPAIPPMQQDAWAKRFAYRAQNLRLMKETFRSLRGNLIALTRSASRQDLGRRGAHPEIPNYTARFLIERAAEHTAHHLRQLAVIKAGTR